MTSNPDNSFSLDDLADAYIPSGSIEEAGPQKFGIDYEETAIQVFGLGPSKLDLEEGRAKTRVQKYQPQPERVVNTIVIAARRLYMEDRPLTAQNILEEWDFTVSAPPDIDFIEAFMKTKEFKDKAASIGLEESLLNTAQFIGQKKGGLSAAQHAVISTLTYPDGKTLAMKLKKHKIPWVTFQGWIKDPNFLKYLKLNAEQALEASEAFALIQLVQQIGTGNNKAIDTVLAMTGRWDPSNRKQVDAQKMVTLILQVLDEEITDPDLKDRIGTRLNLLSSDATTVQGELQ